MNYGRAQAMTDNWKNGYIIAECMKQMTSKTETERAIRELIEYHVEAALKAASSVVRPEYLVQGADKDVMRKKILSAYSLDKIV